MATETTLTLREVRDSIGRRVDAAWYGEERTIITKNGEPRAVLLSYGEYRSLTGAAVGPGE